MTKTPFSLAADLISAATALHSYFEALKGAGFTDSQAFAIVRDMARAGSANG
ncbi:hypothetical protein [Streptomyces sp. NPDC051364]|uniref:hypothetical protein n=1 Tax=Streptomyces sp. NPDC051364 TaxID=3155799 RepID=UPI00344AF706